MLDNRLLHRNTPGSGDTRCWRDANCPAQTTFQTVRTTLTGTILDLGRREQSTINRIVRRRPSSLVNAALAGSCVRWGGAIALASPRGDGSAIAQRRASTRDFVRRQQQRHAPTAGVCLPGDAWGAQDLQCLRQPWAERYCMFVDVLIMSRHGRVMPGCGPAAPVCPRAIARS